MIKTFNTSSGTVVEGKGTNTIIYVLMAAAALYAGYKFWWKPMQDKKNAALK
jgi:Tfp pilus assembly protein PilO